MRGKLHAEKKLGRPPVEVHFEDWRAVYTLAENLSIPFFAFDHLSSTFEPSCFSKAHGESADTLGSYGTSAETEAPPGNV